METVLKFLILLSLTTYGKLPRKVILYFKVKNKISFHLSVNSLKCYECNSFGAECAPIGDDYYGELVECAEGEACFTTFRYTGNLVRYCRKLPENIYDKECVMKRTNVMPGTPDFYYFECYCTSDACNDFDFPPCDSQAGYCDAK